MIPLAVAIISEQLKKHYGFDEKTSIRAGYKIYYDLMNEFTIRKIDTEKEEKGK